MAKAKFTTHGSGAVTVEYDDVMSGLRQTRTFASYGRYVYELMGATGKERQICKGLSHSGETLMVHEAGENILPIIRREYLRMRRADLKLAS